MVLLPMVERELRGAARGRALYRVRFWAVLAMSAMFGWNMLSFQQYLSLSQAGLEVLSILTLMAFGFSLIIGVIATSDSISREKREGTLGLLFLTDLKGYDVICGKLAANSINAFYALVAILPVLSIPLLMGGVTFVQFCKLSLVLMTTMVLSLAVGIFVSTFSRNERKAMVFTILALLSLTFFLPYLVIAMMMSRAQSPGVPWLGAMFSPGFGLIQTLAPPAAFAPASKYWLSLAWQWLVAALLIAIASAHVPHSWQESGAARKPGRRPFKFRFPGWRRAVLRRERLEKNPYLWLALRDEASEWRVWFFVLSLFTIWLIGVRSYGLRMMVEDMMIVFMGVIHWTLRIWVASEASRRFVDERNNNTFEFLLTTPLTERQIIRGQWLSLWRQFAGPVAGVLAWEGFMVLTLHSHPGWGWESSISAVLPMFFLVFDLVALGWVGLWLGLICRGRTKAILGSLALVTMVPRVLYLAYFALHGFAARHSIVYSTFFPSFQPATVRLCSALLVNGTAILWIRSRLPKQLRTLAARQ